MRRFKGSKPIIKSYFYLRFFCYALRFKNERIYDLETFPKKSFIFINFFNIVEFHNLNRHQVLFFLISLVINLIGGSISEENVAFSNKFFQCSGKCESMYFLFIFVINFIHRNCG
jgi:hypothetical protein